MKSLKVSAQALSQSRREMTEIRKMWLVLNSVREKSQMNMNWDVSKVGDRLHACWFGEYFSASLIVATSVRTVS